MAWTNPYYNSGNSVAGGGNNRYDHTQPGSGIPGAQTFADGAKLFDSYAQKQEGNTVYSDAVEWMRSKGIDPANATDKEKFTATDYVFRDRQRGNKKLNDFGSSTLGKVLSVAAPIGLQFIPGIGQVLGPVARGALSGGLSGAISGNGNIGSIAKGAAVGGAAGYAWDKFSPAIKNSLNIGGKGGYSPGSIDWEGGLNGLPDTYNYGLDNVWSAPGMDNAAFGFNYANAVPGSRTGVTTPSSGGGLTTQQGAGPGYNPRPGQPAAVPGGHLLSKPVPGAPTTVSSGDLSGGGGGGIGSDVIKNALKVGAGIAGAIGGNAPPTGAGSGSGGAGAYSVAQLPDLVSQGGDTNPNIGAIPPGWGGGGGGGFQDASGLRSSLGAGKMSPYQEPRVGYKRSPFANYLALG